MHQNSNDQFYGQTDAMELTPSAGSMSSSNYRNLGGKTPEPVVDHVQSNDSIMNPKIIAMGGANSHHQSIRDDPYSNGGEYAPSGMYSVKSNNENINIQDHAQSQGRFEQPGSARNATISLSQLQAQFNQNLQPPSSGKVSAREIQKVESGYFGSQDEANFKQVDFENIDQEEMLLEEQYRQMSQNQRVPHRLPVSRETASVITSQRMVGSNRGYGNSGEKEMATMSQISQRQHTLDDDGPQTAPRIQSSRQSLVRDTSPFNQRHHSESTVQFKGDVRSASMNSNENLSVCTEENYKRLKIKINEQAQRLLQLQNQVKKGQTDESLVQQIVEKYELAAKKQEKVIADLQQRNMEISKGILNQSEIQQRLQISEENLRKETALSEEQRAQISILKAGIESNLERLGLRFSINKNRGSQDQIDGYLQLMRYAQINEQQKNKIQTLNDQLLKFEEKFQKAVQNVENEGQQSIQRIMEDNKNLVEMKDREIRNQEEKNENLKTEREQLLDFIEKNNETVKTLEENMRSSQEENSRVKSDLQYFKQKFDEQLKQTQNKDELLGQVKDNLQDMRGQRESLYSENSSLKTKIDQLQLSLKLDQDQLMAQRKEIANLNQALADRDKMQKELQVEIDNNLAGKDQEMSGLRLKLKDWSESLLVKDEILGKQRIQIQDLKSKVMALEESKEALKRTMSQTQIELINLVQLHEKLTQQMSQKQQDLIALTSDNTQLKIELSSKRSLIDDFQTRLKCKDDDLRKFKDIQSETANIHLQNERKFLQDYKNVEIQKRDLELKIKKMNEQLQERSMKIDYLEKVRKDNIDQEKHLKKTIDIKTYAYEELTKEVRNIKCEFENKNSVFEQTMSAELQQASQKEMKLNQQIDRMALEIENLRRHKELADKQLLERNEKLRNIESVEFTKWQMDMTRLENEANYGQERNRQLQQDNENLRHEIKSIGNEMQNQRLDSETQRSQLIKISNSVNRFIQQISQIDGLYQKYEQFSKILTLKPDENLFDCLELVFEHVRSTLLSNGSEVLYNNIQQDKDLPRRYGSASARGASTGREEASVNDLKVQLQIEREAKIHYDVCLQKLGTLLIVKSEIRQLLVDVLQQIKQFQHYKNENRLLQAKMQENEQRYNLVIKSPACQNEASQLRQNMDNDKDHLAQIQRKISAAESEIDRCLTEMIKHDKNTNWTERESELKLHALTEEVNELRKNYQEASCRKEWAQAKLNEIQHQLGMFQTSEGSTLNTRRRLSANRPNTVIDHTDSIGLPPTGPREKNRLSFRMRSPEHYRSLRDFSNEEINIQNVKDFENFRESSRKRRQEIRESSQKRQDYLRDSSRNKDYPSQNEQLRFTDILHYRNSTEVSNDKNHERVPTEISVKNILMSKFNQGPTMIESESNKYKRDPQQPSPNISPSDNAKRLQTILSENSRLRQESINSRSRSPLRNSQSPISRISEPNSEFIHYTKGNHLLPLQRSQEQYYSYVKTNEQPQAATMTSYVETNQSNNAPRLYVNKIQTSISPDQDRHRSPHYQGLRPSFEFQKQ